MVSNFLLYLHSFVMMKTKYSALMVILDNMQAFKHFSFVHAYLKGSELNIAIAVSPPLFLHKLYPGTVNYKPVPLLTLKVLVSENSLRDGVGGSLTVTSYCSLNPYGRTCESSASSYIADPTSPIPSHSLQLFC